MLDLEQGTETSSLTLQMMTLRSLGPQCHVRVSGHLSSSPVNDQPCH